MNLFEIQLLDWISEHLSCGFLDIVMPIITFLGNGGWFWIAVSVVMMCFKKTRKTGVMVGVALIMGLLTVNLFLKPVVARIRPYDVNPYVQLLIEKPHDFSFPSGHTVASFEGAVVLFLRERKYIGIPALVLAALISFSRLYLYVHYPSDVAVSVILGTVFACVSVWLVNYVWNKVCERKQTIKK